MAYVNKLDVYSHSGILLYEVFMHHDSHRNIVIGVFSEVDKLNKLICNIVRYQMSITDVIVISFLKFIFHYLRNKRCFRGQLHK